MILPASPRSIGSLHGRPASPKALDPLRSLFFGGYSFGDGFEEKNSTILGSPIFTHRKRTTTKNASVRPGMLPLQPSAGRSWASDDL